ncbi:MAG: 3-oxoacyl-ACP synthase III [Desulfobulbaceae bacterium]|jgi:3-oxoacyl-[acyl-carrier-protein] synthase-3|nr:3-oxoacyl-ACP synthase III [Desulfobulbaceae bacterium]
MRHVCLDTFAYALPPRTLTSEELEQRLAPVYQRLKLPAGRLEMMSGIKSRRLWPEGTRPSQAAALAGEAAIRRAGIEREKIECLIFTSVCRDMMEPATASFVHQKLGLADNCLLFDLSNACLGFLDGMLMLAQMIELGQIGHGLLVSGETAEDLLASTTRALLADQSLTRKTIKPAFASLTIGSGSVALYMRRAAANEAKPLLAHAAWLANTRHNNLCQGADGMAGVLMATDSEELLARGIETAATTWRKFSAAPGWSEADIGCFFCHQVGSTHARLLCAKLAIDPAKNFQTLADFGNTGSVSAPLTMALAMEAGVFQPGMKAALLGIGSGINCLMLGVNWRKE